MIPKEGSILDFYVREAKQARLKALDEAIAAIDAMHSTCFYNELRISGYKEAKKQSIKLLKELKNVK